MERPGAVSVPVPLCGAALTWCRRKPSTPIPGSFLSLTSLTNDQREFYLRVQLSISITGLLFPVCLWLAASSLCLGFICSVWSDPLFKTPRSHTLSFCAISCLKLLIFWLTPHLLCLLRWVVFYLTPLFLLFFLGIHACVNGMWSRVFLHLCCCLYHRTS